MPFTVDLSSGKPQKVVIKRSMADEQENVGLPVEPAEPVAEPEVPEEPVEVPGPNEPVAEPEPEPEQPAE